MTCPSTRCRLTHLFRRALFVQNGDDSVEWNHRLQLRPAEETLREPIRALNTARTTDMSLGAALRRSHNAQCLLQTPRWCDIVTQWLFEQLQAGLFLCLRVNISSNLPLRTSSVVEEKNRLQLFLPFNELV